MDAPRIRRRGGLLPRLAFALATTVILLELGLRLVLGNGAQGLVVQAARTPEVCFELKPSTTVVYTGDAVRAPSSVIHVNNAGARGEDVAPGARPAGELRVVVLGDELAFGQGVEDDETIASVLGAELGRRGHRASVRAVGVPGSTPSRSVALLEREAGAWKPHLAVLVVSPDDLDAAEVSCPHRGEAPASATLSAGAARKQLADLVTKRLFVSRAARLVGDVGWTGVLDRRGPYAPGRVPRGKAADLAALGLGADPSLASTLDPKALWGDVPLLLPSPTPFPPVVPRNRAEHTFVAALGRLAAAGEAGGFLVAVVLPADRATFRVATRCSDCRPPQELAPAAPVHVVDLSTTWAQLVRLPGVYFQPGEGLPNAEGTALLGRAAAAELASWRPLRERSTAP